MAQIVFDIPDAQANRISGAVCARFGWTPEGGQNQVEFTRDMVFVWLRDLTLSYEAEMAADAARATVLENPDDPLAGGSLSGI